MLMYFFILILIVGFVTAGLSIRFDRFFTILLLLFLFKLNIYYAVNIFLWVIMAGALMVLLNNKDKILSLPQNKKRKLFILIPIFTAFASLLGTIFFVRSGQKVLLFVLALLAVLYGLRLMFIHFKKHELAFEQGHPGITKMCGLLGPWISGFFIGFIGTSLKPLKIPFAIKIGKMNIKQVYLGNTITTFFASLFAIFWHFVLLPQYTTPFFFQDMIFGLALWTGIHFMYELTEIVFPKKWKKLFQILIGFLLILASIKVFMLIK